MVLVARGAGAGAGAAEPRRRSAIRGCWPEPGPRTLRFPVEVPSEIDTASPKSLAAPVAWVAMANGAGAGGCNKGSGAQLQSMGESFPFITRLFPFVLDARLSGLSPNSATFFTAALVG